MKSTTTAAGQLEATQFPDLAASERKILGRIRQIKRVVVAYPSGNTTAIIFDQLPAYNPQTVNDGIMRAWKIQRSSQPEIEQCCMVTKPQDSAAIARIQMLGGEFCGNATRSALWLLAGGQPRAGLVEVSGVDRPLTFSVSGKEVMLEMPLPLSDTLVRRVNEGWLVQLDGIAQLVMTPGAKQTPRQLLDDLLRSNRYKLANQPAVGVSSYDEISKQATFSVWVKKVQTIFDETACGSGTSAIGVAQAWQTGQTKSLDVIQPSGNVIRTEAICYHGAVNESRITGAVQILYDGALELS